MKNPIGNDRVLYAGQTLKRIFQEIMQDGRTPISLEELATTRVLAPEDFPGQEYNAQGTWQNELVHTGTFIQYDFTRDGVTATMLPWNKLPDKDERRIWWHNYHGNVKDGPLEGTDVTFAQIPPADRINLDAQQGLRDILANSYAPILDALFQRFPNRKLFGLEMENPRALTRYEPIILPIALSGLNPSRGEYMTAIAKRTGESPTPYGVKVIAK